MPGSTSWVVNVQGTEFVTELVCQDALPQAAKQGNLTQGEFDSLAKQV
ncbi:MAG: hypothetical protein IPN26_16205 [Bacteroidetes bacterium]|nr:hypothetical protein [Bacteroidota bacterium]